MNNVKILLLLPFILLLNACSATIPIHLAAAHYINPDAKGASLPVQVKIYTLTSKNAFMHATFHDLWLRDQATLGTALIIKKYLILSPSTHLITNLKYTKRSHYIGAIAIFRRPVIAKWRAIIKIPTGASSLWRKIIIKIHGHRIDIKT
jgi:type VI secretion system VasD/TssJ family lipoprotein